MSVGRIVSILTIRWHYAVVEVTPLFQIRVTNSLERDCVFIIGNVVLCDCVRLYPYFSLGGCINLWLS